MVLINPSREHKLESLDAKKYGAGVIISEDGYIVTNNHVIDKANYIEVTFMTSLNIRLK